MSGITKAKSAIFNAKTQCKMLEPYLTVLWNKMPCVETTEVPTMAVDHANRMYVNPDFANQLEPMQVAYCVLHETLHVALGHCKMLQTIAGGEPTEQQAFVWNVATDLVIQQMLAKHHRCSEIDGIITIDGMVPKSSPPTAMRDVPGLAPGMNSMQYYSLLMDFYKQQKEDQGDGDAGDQSGEGSPSDSQSDDDGDSDTPPQALDPADAGSASDGIPKPWELSSTPSDQTMVDQHRQEVREACDTEPGNMSESIKASLDYQLQPQRDWFPLVRSCVCREVSGAKGRKHETFARISRRQQPGLPRMLGSYKAQPKVSIICDTSASMDGLYQRAFTAIAQGCRGLNRPRVVSFDTEMHDAKNLSNAKQFEWVGRGGTRLDRAVIEEDSRRPQAIVVITDGETRWPDARPRAKVIICLVKKPRSHYPTPSWATVIDCSEEARCYCG